VRERRGPADLASANVALLFGRIAWGERRFNEAGGRTWSSRSWLL